MKTRNSQPLSAKGDAQRLSNFELLRIIAMIMILMEHFASHSGFPFPEEFTFNRLWVELVAVFGHISVNVFVLISGYFRIQSHKSNTAKVMQLWLQLFFYSMVIYFAFVLMGKAPFAWGEIIRRALPVSFLQWWFASTFFVLLLFSPYLNRLLETLSQKQYQGFLALMLICWSLIPTVTGQSFEGNNLLWFVCLYATGGYVRLFGLKTKLSAGKLILLSVFCVLLTFLTVVLLGYFAQYSEYLDKKRFYFYKIHRLPLLIISALLFAGFTRLSVKPSKIINIVASAMFGVYLIHDHSYIRYYLWLDLFHNMDHADDPLLILRFLGEICIIFICCTLIELVRVHLLEKHYMPAVRRFADTVDRRKENLFSHL